MTIIDWRRLSVALPILVVLAAGLLWLLREGDATASTPKAALIDTHPVAGYEIGVQKGRVARDFSATTAHGEPFRLSDLRGTPAIINFWATWCTSCLVEMPDLKEVQAEFGVESLRVVAVNSGESRDDALEFITFLDADDFIYVMDPSLAVTDAYGVIGLSTSVFVDADGVIRATYIGQLPKDLTREFASATIAATEAAEPPVRFRLPGTVEARTSVLVVDDVSKETLRITSRRLRCDDSFCAHAIANEIEGIAGVVVVHRALIEDPPYVEVTFDAGVIDPRRLLAAIATAVNDGGDPLYQSAVTIEDGEG